MPDDLITRWESYRVVFNKEYKNKWVVGPSSLQFYTTVWGENKSKLLIL